MRSFTSHSSSFESEESGVIGLYTEGCCGGLLGLRIGKILFIYLFQIREMMQRDVMAFFKDICF